MKLSDLSEVISDRAGLEAAESPSAYAGLLLEFAALPHPALNGVAMASSRNLSHRIERLLNETTFQRAFAGGRRALLAVLITSVLIAAPAMVRVSTCSASQEVSAAAIARNQASAPSAVAGQSDPQPAQMTDASAAQAPVAQATPEPPPAAAPVPAQPSAPEAGSQEPMPAAPPMPPVHIDISAVPSVHVDIPAIPAIHVVMPQLAEMYAYAYRGSCFGDDDSYAIVGDPGTKTRFCGDWDDDGHSDVEKARSQAHGHFLLIRRDGKLYILDDPETMHQIEAMDAAADSLRDQMREMGKQLRDESQQAREAARKAREIAQNIPAPDLSKEFAELDATAASLKQAQGGTVSREQLQQLQREISELQRRVIQAEISFEMKGFNGDMAELGKQQGKYGEQMGKLGAEMGKTMRENNEKIRSTIDESLKNGKARPVN